MSNHPQRREIERYPYADENGEHLYDVVRYEPKSFAQQRADGAWSMDGVRYVLYRLQRVIEAVACAITIFIVEGEKDVHAIEAAGGYATCNPGGAGRWRDSYTQFFEGAARVRIVADRRPSKKRHHRCTRIAHEPFLVPAFCTKHDQSYSFYTAKKPCPWIYETCMDCVTNGDSLNSVTLYVFKT